MIELCVCVCLLNGLEWNFVKKKRWSFGFLIVKIPFQIPDSNRFVRPFDTIIFFILFLVPFSKRYFFCDVNFYRFFDCLFTLYLFRHAIFAQKNVQRWKPTLVFNLRRGKKLAEKWAEKTTTMFRDYGFLPPSHPSSIFFDVSSAEFGYSII